MIRAFGLVLPAVALVFAASRLGASPVMMMVLSSIAMIPIAGIMGKATEHLSHRVGPTVGGLVNATFGNACELIIAILALRAGMIDIVKASITGSIVGNVLLVLGGSMLAGGLKHEMQTFNRLSAVTAYTFLTIASFGLMMPAALHNLASFEGNATLHVLPYTHNVGLAVAISIVLLTLYVLGLLFSLKTHKHLFAPVAVDDTDAPATNEAWNIQKSLALIALSTGAVVYLSSELMNNVEAAATSLGMTPVFVGIILVAVIGNAAENSTAISMARKNKMDLAINIALGSSTQIAMFVAPVLVGVGLLIGQPMDLNFTFTEVIAVFGSVIVMTNALQDGKTNWLEGAGLLATYAIIAISFYFQ